MLVSEVLEWMSLSPHPPPRILLCWYEESWDKKNKKKVMHNHIICLQVKHFFKVVRHMQFITSIQFIIHVYKICVLVLDTLTLSFKELFKNTFESSP